MKKPKIIVGLGEILWDIYPGHKHLGGAPANVAVHSHLLGERGVIVSGVGQDFLGDELLDSLERRGLSSRYLQCCSHKSTGTVGVTLNREGIPQFACSSETAFDNILWNDGLAELAGKADAVIVGTLAQRHEDSRKTIHRFLDESKQAVKVFDVNFREWNGTISQIVRDTLIYADILKLNESELDAMQSSLNPQSKDMRMFFDFLSDRFELRLIALSLGEKGCFLTDGREHVFSPGYKVSALDTTGCGDGFVAGLVNKFLENSSLQAMAEYANIMGGFLATLKGATPGYSKKELNQFQDVHTDRHDKIFLEYNP